LSFLRKSEVKPHVSIRKRRRRTIREQVQKKLTAKQRAKIEKEYKLWGSQLEDADVFKAFYHDVPCVHDAIDTITDAVLQHGYEVQVEPKDLEETRKMVSDKLEEFGLPHLLHQIVREYQVFGNAFLEKLRDNEGRIAGLNAINPEYIRIKRDEHGRVEKYNQVIQGRLEVSFEPQDIVHFKRNPIGDDPFGISICKPLKTIMETKLQSEEDIGKIIHYYGAPIRHFKFGTADKVVAPEVVDDLRADIESMDPEDDIFTDGLVDIKVIGAERRTMAIEELMDRIENQVISGLEVPDVLLGRGRGATEATAKVQLRAFDRRVRSIQKYLKYIIDKEIVEEIVKDYDLQGRAFIEFPPLEERKLEEIAPWVIKAYTADVPLLSREEARKLLGLE